MVVFIYLILIQHYYMFYFKIKCKLNICVKYIPYSFQYIFFRTSRTILCLLSWWVGLYSSSLAHVLSRRTWTAPWNNARRTGMLGGRRPGCVSRGYHSSCDREAKQCAMDQLDIPGNQFASHTFIRRGYTPRTTTGEL